MPTTASIQAPCAVVMVRPHRFCPNPHTAHDNAFQAVHSAGLPADLARRAHAEVTEAAAQLDAAGVRVHLFDDLGERDTPDAVFPNNWFSTHPGGHVAVYPMYAANRRSERRSDVLEMLKAEYRVQDVIARACSPYFSGSRRPFPACQSRRATPRVRTHTLGVQRRVARWE